MCIRDRGYTAYTSNHGLLELREEIVKKVKREHDVDYCAKEEALSLIHI